MPTILIVEDNDITRKMVRVALATEGYRVLEAGSGATAVAEMTATRVDLVLQDLVLPDMDGFELVTRLRALPGGAEVPIIAFSGFLSRSEASRALAAGFTDMFVKPIEPSRLLRSLRTYLPAAEPAPPSPARGRRVLVADDDPIALKLARVHLQQRGFEVLTATDGAEALERARAEPPDAILSDVLMPRIDGFQLCLAVREDPVLRGVPVVLCSANYVEDSDRALAERVGANALVVRTPDLADAIAALVTSLGRAAAPAPIGPPERLEAERLHRVVRQLERQVAMNASLVQRASLQATILSLVASMPGSLSNLADIEAAPGEALAAVLDTGGISSGALYLRDAGGRLRLQVRVGLGEGGLDFYGHPELFELADRSETGVAIPSATVPQQAARDFLDRASVSSAVIVPLGPRGHSLGALLLGSRSRDLTDLDWLAFGRSVGSQLGHTIELGRAFARLTASEQHYRALFENMPIGMFRSTPGGRLLAVNSALVAMFRYPDAEALLAVPVEDLYVSPEAREQLKELVHRDGVVRGFEAQNRCHDGTVIWTRESVRSVLDEGRIVYEGSMEDITAQRTADQRRLAVHLVNRVLAENPEAHEAPGRLLEVLCRTVEWDLGEMWQPNLRGTELIRTETWHDGAAPMARFVEASRSYTFAPGEGLPGRAWTTVAPQWTPALGPDTHLPRRALGVEAGLRAGLAFPIAAGDEVLAVMCFLSSEIGQKDDDLLRMVTNVGNQIGQFMERRRAEAALERHRATLVQTEKLAAMGQLLAGVAHELNNPLSVVLGQASLLESHTAGTPTADRAQKIGKAADRCARIVRNFLALARQHPPERRRVSVNAVAREAVELLAYALRTDTIDTEFDLAPDVPSLWADPHQLHQVVVNLVTNAQHALRDHPTPRRITLASRVDPDRGLAILTVADNGPGIPEDIRARIFEPFFTTKVEGQGTGLGLPLCLGIVESHGGTLSVDDGPAGGAVFTIALPVIRGDTPAEREPAEAKRTALSRHRILIVDDEPALVDLLHELLSGKGNELESAPSGRVALERLAAGPFDLVMSDLRMPEMDGPSLYRETRARGHHVPFLFMTGDTLRPDVRQFLERTGLPCLVKPFGVPELLAGVAKAVTAEPAHGRAASGEDPGGTGRSGS
jgi:PAS domain S-box-containing protein